MARVISAVLVALGGLLSIPAAALEVRVTAVESMDDLMRWFQQKPAPRGTFPTVDTLVVGKKVYLPIVVSGIDRTSRAPLNLVADIEISEPKGKTMTLRQCCRYSVADRSGLVTAILDNTPVFQLDPGDAQGVYTIRASVTDGTTRATGTYQMRHVAAEAKPAPARKDPGTKAAPPKEADAALRRPARGTDLRHCLALPTPAEVARCSEGR